MKEKYFLIPYDKRYKPYLDLSLISKEYEPILSDKITFQRCSSLFVTNCNLGLDMRISKMFIDIMSNDSFEDKHGYMIKFKTINLKHKPSKYFISILVEWFANLKEIPHIEFMKRNL